LASRFFGVRKIIKVTIKQNKIAKVERFEQNLKFNFFIIFCCAILFLVGSKQSVAAPKTKPETPTRIRSDIIDIKRKSQTIDFFHNVVVEKDDSSLLAQKMRVFYENKPAENVAEGEKKQSSIQKIEAKENVKIFSEDFIASGDFGYYEPKKDSFILEKNVIVNNGTSIASGDKFLYDLKTKKGVFIGRKDETSIVGNGGDKRVVVVIGNDLQGKKKSKKEKNE
jgi:lipopolysaccharide transport protein LptA